MTRILFPLLLSASLLGCSAKKDLEAQRAYSQECDEKLAAAEAQLAELQALQALVDARLAAYQDLANKLRLVLGGADGIKLIVRNGRLVVQLPNEILFESGSSSLNSQGEKTLAAIAPVLNRSGRSFLIAGHTDNVPVKDKATAYHSNWELSTQRAITVVQFLEGKRVPSVQMAATGYGEHQPIGDNATDAGRKSNRRLEIIILPKLDEIPEFPSEI